MPHCEAIQRGGGEAPFHRSDAGEEGLRGDLRKQCGEEGLEIGHRWRLMVRQATVADNTTAAAAAAATTTTTTACAAAAKRLQRPATAS